MTQTEIVEAIRRELKGSISQAYLSQVENGRRKHMTETTRMLLARFFKVHPGHLVTDPEGFHTELMSGVRASEQSLDRWLTEGAEQFRRDPAVAGALGAVASNEDSRKCVILLGKIVELPELADRLLQVLAPPPEIAAERPAIARPARKKRGGKKQ
jgi:transcriptional regulator with XRE-family HTH domain